MAVQRAVGFGPRAVAGRQAHGFRPGAHRPASAHPKGARDQGDKQLKRDCVRRCVTGARNNQIEATHVTLVRPAQGKAGMRQAGPSAHRPPGYRWPMALAGAMSAAVTAPLGIAQVAQR